MLFIQRCCAFVLILLGSSLAQVEIFLVNVFDVDATDLDILDDQCDIEAVTVGDQCTLRAAIMQANATDGVDTINFASATPISLDVPAADDDFDPASGDLDIFQGVIINGLLQNGVRPLTFIQNTVANQRTFDILTQGGQEVLLNGLRLAGGDSDSYGGAIRLQGSSIVVLDRVELSNNSAPSGGAVAAIGPTGSLTIRNSDIHHNDADQAGAAVYSNGNVLIENSSFWENQNSDVADKETIYATGNGILSVNNTTISHNSGGIYANNSQLDVYASTITNNTQYGLFVEKFAGNLQFNLFSSILTGNPASDCSTSGLFVGKNVNHYNLIADGGADCDAASYLTGDAGLAPELTFVSDLPSRVRFPLAGSPVIDAIPAGDAACLAFDQRGMARPIDSNDDGTPQCDIGAVELTQTEAGPRIFTVNYSDDWVDNNPGDTRCDGGIGTGDQCTLRAAIMESNALPGFNMVFISESEAEIILNKLGSGGDDVGDLDITDTIYIVGANIDTAMPEDRPLIQSSNGDRVFDINAPGHDVVLLALRLTGGATAAGESGGAVRIQNANDTIIGYVEMFGNSADIGGGAIGTLNGETTLVGVDLHDNVTPGLGSALYNTAPPPNEVVIFASSIRNNSPPGGANPAAVHGAAGSNTQFGSSTISSNEGNGIRVDAGGFFSARNSTIANNSLLGITFATVAGSTFHLDNTILDSNLMGSCFLEGGAFGTIETDGHNLSGADGCTLAAGGTNIVGGGAMLGELVTGTNRYTAYHLPGITSAAIDAGDPAAGACLDADQLGTVRPVDGDGVAHCDIGAIEYDPNAPLFADGFED